MGQEVDTEEVEDDDTEYEIVAEEEDSKELWLTDGETWFADVWAFCEEFGVLGISTFEGIAVCFVKGVGVVSLDKVLKGEHLKPEKPKGGLTRVK